MNKTIPIGRAVNSLASPQQEAPPDTSTNGFPEHFLEKIIEYCFPDDMTNRQQEVEICLTTARHYGLNPLLNEIRFVNSKGVIRGRDIWAIKPLVGRDGLVALAHRSGKYGGMDTSVEVKEWPHFNKETQAWDIYNQPVATAKVYRKDSAIPTTVSVGFWEYAKRDDGTIPDFWQKLGVTMTCKVAECQALRKAFNLSGLYSPEEMNIGYIDDTGDMQTRLPVDETVPTPTQLKETPPAAETSQTETPQLKQPSRVQVPKRQPTKMLLKERVARATEKLLSKGFTDISNREADVMNGDLEVTSDVFIVRQATPDMTVILAWCPPESPKTPFLDQYGMIEDTFTKWWTIELT